MSDFVSVIIPAYNEGSRIKDTIENIVKFSEFDEIIVVDDGSSDNTKEVVESLNEEKLKFKSCSVNRGKGAALNTGLSMVDDKATIIGFIDADLGRTSSDAIKLLGPVTDGSADVTIAKFKPAKRKGGMGFVKRLAKDSVFELTGVEINSALSGQRFFRREVLSIFDEIPFGYGVEVGMTVDILNNGYKIKEVLVDMTHNETGRNLKGFIHRGKQYLHIKKIVKQKKKEMGK